MSIIYNIHVPAQTGVAINLCRGQTLRITDPMGGQVADLVAFAKDNTGEWLSNGRTFDYGGTIRLTVGHVLWSNRSRAMLTIMEDDVGRHDFLFTPCSQEMFAIQYGITGDHPSCLENLASVLGVNPDLIPTPFNVFMNVNLEPSGELKVLAPQSEPGDSIVLRAEMDLSVGVAACAAGVCNAGRCTPIDVAVLSS